MKVYFIGILICLYFILSAIFVSSESKFMDESLEKERKRQGGIFNCKRLVLFGTTIFIPIFLVIDVIAFIFSNKSRRFAIYFMMIIFSLVCLCFI